MRRVVPIRRSLHRHFLVMGAEREPLLFSGLIALLLGAGGQTALSITTAIVFWLGAVAVLRRMAKADPIMTAVWRSYYNQQDYYPARISLWRKQ